MATFQQRGARWRAIVRKAGHPAQSKTFRTKGQAQRWAKALEDSIESGEFSGQAVMDTVTIGQVLDAHREHLGRISNRDRRIDSDIRVLKRDLGEDMVLADLDYATLSGFARSRIDNDKVKGSTVLHNVMTLSGAISTAVLELGVPAEFAAQVSSWRKGLSRAGLIRAPESRDRRPTEEELDSLLVHTQHNRALRRIPYHDIIRFAVASAMRLDEICSLRWEDVDLVRGVAVIRLRKHPTDKTDQLVPLMGESCAIIERQPREEGEGRVFPVSSDSVSNGFRRICRHLKIEDLHFHDLRHEAISRMFEQGYQIQEVAMVSGHRDWKNLKRYVNLRPEALAQRDRERSGR